MLQMGDDTVASRSTFVIPAPDDSEIRNPQHMTGASTDAVRSVACSDVCFSSGRETIAATWYRPDVLAAPVPCVVMGHGFTLTRRDGVPGYARRLAAAGFAALAFDYRHWETAPVVRGDGSPCASSSPTGKRQSGTRARWKEWTPAGSRCGAFRWEAGTPC